eukprot:GGOE01037174.1.p1 GENE.GGOE01037174.1~~GGOE01037174.1.p1  ORF type:complete len:415 (+),score=81.43 GGOE01037174.1:65-1309(+)
MGTLALALLMFSMQCFFGAQSIEGPLQHLKAFKQLLPPSMTGFTMDAQCVRRNEQFGLNVVDNVCWDGHQLFIRCSERSISAKYELDDFFNFQAHLLPAASYDARVANHTIKWLNGTAFMMTSHLWPHNAQHIWPALNVVAMGLPLRHIGVFGTLHYGNSGAMHHYSMSLMNAMVDFFNLTFIPSPDLSHAHAFWSSFSQSTPLCFEQIVIANKGPSPRFGTCTGAFMSPLVVQRQKQKFLEHFYARARKRVTAQSKGPSRWPLEFPKEPPRKVLLLNRRDNRVMLNEDQVVTMIESMGVPVGKVQMEGKSLDEQFLHMSQAGILVSPHGANLINALLMPMRSVAVEVFLRPEIYKCEWSQYLQSSGVPCLVYCWNNGNPCPPSAPAQPYPRTNGTVDVDRLKRTIKFALRLLK